MSVYGNHIADMNRKQLHDEREARTRNLLIGFLVGCASCTFLVCVFAAILWGK